MPPASAPVISIAEIVPRHFSFCGGIHTTSFLYGPSARLRVQRRACSPHFFPSFQSLFLISLFSLSLVKGLYPRANIFSCSVNFAPTAGRYRRVVG
ncbi:hypothetical protein BDZ89DRAFT_314237 [Hymenopellis radicata]|nr:hypothetical protein BDZ89DRAFT_314237 [Hymenopellis radicata]